MCAKNSYKDDCEWVAKNLSIGRFDNPEEWLDSAEHILSELGHETHGVECIGFEQANEGLWYINRGDTYDKTLCIDISWNIEITSWGDWFEEKEEDYCESENMVRCAYCGEYVTSDQKGVKWDELECYCGHYVNGMPIKKEPNKEKD